MRVQISEGRFQIERRFRIEGRFRIAALAVVCALCSGAARAETIDRVLAVAAGQIITLTDVTAAQDLGFASPGIASDPVRAILAQLIDRALVLTEVDRYAPPEPASDAVERELTAVHRRFATAAGYEAALAVSGLDDNAVRDLVRQNLRMRAYLDQRFSPSDPRRQALIDEWVAGLRRRGDVVDLYGATGS